MGDLPWELGWPFNEAQSAILLLMSEGMDEDEVAAFFPMSTLAVMRLLAPMRLSRQLESVDDFKTIVAEIELHRYRDRIFSRNDGWGLLNLTKKINEAIEYFEANQPFHPKTPVVSVSFEASGDIPDIPAKGGELGGLIMHFLYELLNGQRDSRAASVRLFYPKHHDHIQLEFSASDVYIGNAPIESSKEIWDDIGWMSAGFISIPEIIENHGGNLVISVNNRKITVQVSLPATNKFSRDDTGPPGRVDPQ